MEDYSEFSKGKKLAIIRNLIGEREGINSLWSLIFDYKSYDGYPKFEYFGKNLSGRMSREFDVQYKFSSNPISILTKKQAFIAFRDFKADRAKEIRETYDCLIDQGYRPAYVGVTFPGKKDEEHYISAEITRKNSQLCLFIHRRGRIPGLNSLIIRPTTSLVL